LVALGGETVESSHGGFDLATALIAAFLQRSLNLHNLEKTLPQYLNGRSRGLTLRRFHASRLTAGHLLEKFSLDHLLSCRSGVTQFLKKAPQILSIASIWITKCITLVRREGCCQPVCT
jgi:hypothetical protein